MAAPAIMSQLRRRFISTQLHHHRNSIIQASSWHLLDRYALHKKGFFLTDTNRDKHVCEDAAGSSKPSVISDNVPTSVSINEKSCSGATISANSSLKTTSRHNFSMYLNCNLCKNKFCQEWYKRGVVVAQCRGCTNLHLIADHLLQFVVNLCPQWHCCVSVESDINDRQNEFMDFHRNEMSIYAVHLLQTTCVVQNA